MRNCEQEYLTANHQPITEWNPAKTGVATKPNPKYERIVSQPPESVQHEEKKELRREFRKLAA